MTTFTQYNLPKEWYKGAQVFEWHHAGIGCEPGGLWGDNLPYITQRDVDLIQSIKAGDLLELTSENDGWTREYDVQAIGIDLTRQFKNIYIVKKGGVKH